MNKTIFVVLVLITLIQTEGNGGQSPERKESEMPIESNNVIITPVAVNMPLGKILLVRRNSDYCAIKFTKIWSENATEVDSIFAARGSDQYAMYDSYYQADKTGDFSKKNVQFKKDKLSFPKPRGIGRFSFSFGNKDVRCGPFQLFWFGQGWIYFYGSGQKESDYDIELSPTKWTDIGQVNVSEPRLKWYRYDAKRQDTKIAIDELWKD